MKTSSIIAGLVIAILVVGGIMWYSSMNNTTNPQAAQYPTMPSDQTQQNANQTQTAPEQTQSSASASANTAAPAPSPAPAPRTVTVTYNGSSFSPATITIHVGDTITFVDSSSNPMWVASGVHPTHTVYDGTSRTQHCAPGYTGPTPFDECQASTANYSFTFTKAGTWPFHNHVNPSATGQVVVQ